MIIATTARTDMDGVKTAFQNNELIKVFKHADGWSVECPAGIMKHNDADVFSGLEPLVNALKDNGIDRMQLEP